MIPLINPDSEIYFPTGAGDDQQLSKTTHLGIGAHQDDLEILAIHGILEAINDPKAFFTGVTVTDGRGAPRPDTYQDMDEDTFWQVRCEEQKKAADLGRYNAQFLLNYSSQTVKFGDRRDVVEDLKQILKATSPSIIYTHNLADKHDTHIAVVLSVIRALREVKPALKDVSLYGCEVWRGLDWMCDNEKIAFDVSSDRDLQTRLLKIFDSQIAGGKRYDLAAIGRQEANATYFESHQIDAASRLVYAMDLTPLIDQPEMDIVQFVDKTLQDFTNDVMDRLHRLGGNSA